MTSEKLNSFVKNKYIIYNIEKDPLQRIQIWLKSDI